MERFSPLLVLVLGRASRDVERARRALDEACRERDEIVRAVRVEGYGFNEIARHVGLSSARVAAIARRA